MLSTVLRHLDGTKGDWPEIAKASGVPYQTLTKIACRIVADPRVSTVQALLDYFAGVPEQLTPSSSAPAGPRDGFLNIRERALSFCGDGFVINPVMFASYGRLSAADSMKSHIPKKTG